MLVGGSAYRIAITFMLLLLLPAPISFSSYPHCQLMKKNRRVNVEHVAELLPVTVGLCFS